MASDWTKEEHDFLMKHYQERGRAWVAERLGRTQQAIKLRANANGLVPARVYKPKEQNEQTKIVQKKPGLKPAIQKHEIPIYDLVIFQQTFSCRPIGELYNATDINNDNSNINQL